MHAATVDIMVKKAGFDSDVAMAVAEAFDAAITHAQLVTVPMMDARFAAFEAKIDARFMAVDARFTTVDSRFAAVDLRFAALEAKMDAGFAAVDAKFAILESKMEARFALQDERMDKKLEALKSEVVRWVFLAVLGNTALAAGVNALMSALQHFR
jgi:hypothetical protein